MMNEESVDENLPNEGVPLPESYLSYLLGHSSSSRRMKSRVLRRVCAALSSALLLGGTVALGVTPAPAFADDAATASQSASSSASPSAASSQSATDSASASNAAPANAKEIAATYTTSQLADPACVGSEPDALRLTPDGKQLFIVSSADKVCAVNTESWVVEGVIDLPGGSMGVASGIAMSQDGSRLFVATSGGVAAISTATRTVMMLDLTTTNFAVSRDGKTLYALVQDDSGSAGGSTDGGTGWILQVWNVNAGTHTDVAVMVTGSADSSGSDSSSASTSSANLSGAPNIATALVVSGDGSTVLLDAQYSQAEVLLAVDTASGAATSLATFSVGYLATLSSDNTELYVPSASLHTVLQVNVDNRDVQVFSVDSDADSDADSAARITGLALSGDGARLVVRTSAGSHLFDTATGSELRGLALNEPDGYLSRDGSELYGVAAGTGAQIEVRYAQASGGPVAVGNVPYEGAGASSGAVDVKDVAVGRDGASIYIAVSGSSDASGEEDFSDPATAGRLIAVDVSGARAAVKKSENASAAASRVGIVAVAVVAAVIVVAIIWLCRNPQVLRKLAAARSH
ncbi:YncE family protein [Pseudoscardovia suis]|uniref:YncE family protein n=1 Tax=Pseudoscardovia suis TaxID=987063 RepID=UPI003F9AE5CD